MNKVLLPDVGDLESVVADYLDTFAPESGVPDQRQPIIERCVPAFGQLMQLLQDVNATSEVDEMLLKAFMRDLALAMPCVGDVEESFPGKSRRALMH